MDVCLSVSVLCCPVSVEALCWTDPPTMESTKCLWIEKSIKEGQGPIRTVEASGEKKKALHLFAFAQTEDMNTDYDISTLSVAKLSKHHLQEFSNFVI
jgi:hypothetical protein